MEQQLSLLHLQSQETSQQKTLSEFLMELY